LTATDLGAVISFGGLGFTFLAIVVWNLWGRAHFEPKTGFKVTKARVRYNGYYLIEVRDYVTHTFCNQQTKERPKDADVIAMVQKYRDETKKEQDDSESFRAQFEGRVFQE